MCNQWLIFLPLIQRTILICCCTNWARKLAIRRLSLTLRLLCPNNLFLFFLSLSRSCSWLYNTLPSELRETWRGGSFRGKTWGWSVVAGELDMMSEVAEAIRTTPLYRPLSCRFFVVAMQEKHEGKLRHVCIVSMH